MKNNLKKIITVILAGIICLSVTACGNKPPKNINDWTNEDWENAAQQLEDNYEAEKKNNKKNDGKKAVKNETSEMEEVDPFDGLTLVFGGKSPKGKVESINGKHQYVNYSLDVNDGLRNGDVVTVTASQAEFYQETRTLTQTKKEFTVEGLVGYAEKIDDIPANMQAKMQKQAEDSIAAACSSWAEGNTFKSADLVGYYFLKTKDGFQTNVYNEIYCVYKVTGTLKGIKRGNPEDSEPETGEDSYYTYYRYQDIVLLPDGTCSLDLSSGHLYNDKKVDSNYGKMYYGELGYYTFTGYKELDSMFNDCVTKKIDKYEYESTVK